MLIYASSTGNSDTSVQLAAILILFVFPLALGGNLTLTTNFSEGLSSSLPWSSNLGKRSRTATIQPCTIVCSFPAQVATGIDAGFFNITYQILQGMAFPGLGGQGRIVEVGGFVLPEFMIWGNSFTCYLVLDEFIYFRRIPFVNDPRFHDVTFNLYEVLGQVGLPSTPLNMHTFRSWPFLSSRTKPRICFAMTVFLVSANNAACDHLQSVSIILCRWDHFWLRRRSEGLRWGQLWTDALPKRRFLL